MIELLVSLTLCSAILSLVGISVLRLSRVERSIRDEGQHADALRRLAAQFRADVHAARHADVAAGDWADKNPGQPAAGAAPQRVQLEQADGGTIAFQAMVGAIERVEWRGDQIVRRERYRTSERLNVEFAAKPASGVTWVSLVGHETTRTGAVMPRWRIEAALDSNRRDGINPRRRRVTGIRRERNRRRRGAVLAMAMVSLLVVSLMGAALVRYLLITQRQARVAQRHAQAVWLADSGCRRAVAQLRRSADFTGETWTIPTGVLGATTERSTSGTVELTVRPVADQPRRHDVTVTARYPDDPALGITVHRQFTWEIP